MLAECSVWLTSELNRLDACGQGNKIRAWLTEAKSKMEIDLSSKDYTISVIKEFSSRVMKVSTLDKLGDAAQRMPFKQLMKVMPWKKATKKIFD